MKRWLQTWAEDYRAYIRGEMRRADRGQFGRVYTRVKPTMTYRVYRAKTNTWESEQRVKVVDVNGARFVQDGWLQPKSHYLFYRFTNWLRSLLKGI